MIIKVQIHDWNVKRVLIDPGSSADILYCDVFKGMNFDIVELLRLKVPWSVSPENKCKL